MIARNLLLDTGSTIVLVKDGQVLFISKEPGIIPILRIANDSEKYKGSSMADKVTGKTSALLAIYTGITSVYTTLISKPAIEIFNKSKIYYEADNIVDFITDRTGKNKCPFEKSMDNIDDPFHAYNILCDKFGEVILTDE